MLDVIKRAIHEEMQKYSLELQAELEEKYLEEFAIKMGKHRNKIILDVVTNMKMELETSHITGETNIHVKL